MEAKVDIAKLAHEDLYDKGIPANVKIKYIIDNIDVTNLGKINENDIVRVRNYVKAYYELSTDVNPKIIAASIVADLWEIILLFPKKKSALNVDLDSKIEKAYYKIEVLATKIEEMLNSSVLDNWGYLKDDVIYVYVLLKEVYCYIEEHTDSYDIVNIILVILEDTCLSYIKYHTHDFGVAYP